MLLGKQQEMVYFVLLTMYHHKGVVGWPPGRWSSSPGSFKAQSRSFCPDRSDPVLGGSNTCRAPGSPAVGPVCRGSGCHPEAPMPWETGGEQRESQSIPLPLSLGKEAPICCRWTCPHRLVDVHLPTPGLSILSVTEVMGVTLFGRTPALLWVASVIP